MRGKIICIYGNNLDYIKRVRGYICALYHVHYTTLHYTYKNKWAYFWKDVRGNRTDIYTCENSIYKPTFALWTFRQASMIPLLSVCTITLAYTFLYSILSLNRSLCDPPYLVQICIALYRTNIHTVYIQTVYTKLS